MNSASLWGIDLGGTKIEGVVIDPASPASPLARARVATEAEQGYEHVIEQVRKVIAELSTQLGARPGALGIGVPGILDPKSRRLTTFNAASLSEHDFRGDLESALGIPVAIANDANCFAFAEGQLGAARGAQVVFGAILGTGVGGGIVINGEILPGSQGLAGEWGHNPIITDGPQCGCGLKGCVEAVISGPALERFYRERSGRELPLPEIEKEAIAGGEHAVETMARLTRYFGCALATIVKLLDPDVIVVGGGLSGLERLYTDGVREMHANLFISGCTTRVVRNMLGGSAGMYGAALLSRGAARTASNGV